MLSLGGGSGLKYATQGPPHHPVLNTLSSNAGGVGLIPGQGAKIPHSSQLRNQNIEQKQCCNNFSKDFKTGPHYKTICRIHPLTVNVPKSNPEL